MKTNVANPASCRGGALMRSICVAALTAGLGLIPVSPVTAQPAINFEGANPNAGLILSNNTLYGTTAAAGSSGGGTVFAVNTDGTGFRLLHSFSYRDGANPWSGLILSSNTLFGTAYDGGGLGLGTVFAVNTDGSGFTNLHDFAGPASDGAHPIGGLILSSNTLYGTAEFGGDSGQGTVFSLALPPLPQVAQCKHVTVSAGGNCMADASINDGSFSPNAGDTITLNQTPAGRIRSATRV
jgi:uncharacterized repeat protein (TIGR03803 family)